VGHAVVSELLSNWPKYAQAIPAADAPTQPKP